MASLNLSANGPSINSSYTSVVNAPAPTGSAASSPTYGQWAVFSVAAPLVSAFGGDSGKESTLKVQSTGEGELVDLIDEFSDGRIQFAYVKVKDPNTGLPKSALIGWCGEGVPERTKGYFASHQAAVAKVLHGYHVQISARSDRDLTPEGIIQKVSDASGAKYSGGGAVSGSTNATPPVAKKPVFGPTTTNAASGGFNPLANRRAAPSSGPVDDDGWGNDAPQVTRTQLEKVESAYRPTKVDMRSLTSQSSQASAPAAARDSSADRPDVVRGAYQPVGKVDIAAIRKQAAAGGQAKDDRPTTVKGAYEPIGKVDIAAIRAKAQPPGGSVSSAPREISPAQTGASETENQEQRSLADRSSAFQSPGRLAELPKPKVANKFGGGGSFAGTKPLNPGTFGLHGAAPSAGTGLGSAGRSFAESSGKTPAQLWAEKKASQGGQAAAVPTPAQPVEAQNSGGWKSGYGGKKWGAVQTSKVGASAGSVEHEEDIAREERDAPEPPSLNTFNKPSVSGGIAMPGLPSRPKAEEAQAIPPPPAQRRSPTPPAEEEEPSSPIRMAVPVARSAEPEVQDAHHEQMSPPPALPTASLARQVPQHETEDDEPETGPDPGRQAAEGAAVAQFGEEARDAEAGSGGASAIAMYDYEAAEPNELSFPEGAEIHGIEFVDPDWWLGNYGGSQGLFPSNYVELAKEGAADAGGQADIPAIHEPAAAAGSGRTATALYDYEAAEDNELSFGEGSKITNVEFPDDDWWSGTHGGQEGLFPANYVELDQ